MAVSRTVGQVGVYILQQEVLNKNEKAKTNHCWLQFMFLEVMFFYVSPFLVKYPSLPWEGFPLDGQL